MTGSLTGQGGALPAPWIQQPPAGWLGFLGIKSGGRQPGHALPDLQTVLDMYQFYMAGGRTQLASGNPPAVANSPTAILAALTVPQGSVWLIDGIGFSAAAAGAVPALNASVVLSNPLGNFYRVGPQSVAGVTGAGFNGGLQGPLIMMPGDNVRIFTSALATLTAFNYTVFVFGMQVSA